MKVERHGKAKVLSTEEIQLLFNQGLNTLRDRTLFGICLYTACRINEACTLRRVDVYDKRRNVRSDLIIRKNNSKGKLGTRCIPIAEDLRALLSEYNPPVSQQFLFPGRWGKGHLNAMSASRILREAFERIGIEGASTHSMRRTALTTMSNNGIPLRIIQEVSGHRSLEVLEEYLVVKDEQVKGAIASLSHISLKYKHHSQFYRLLGLDAREYSILVIKKLNKTIKKDLPITLDVENPEFFQKLDNCSLHIAENERINISNQPKLFQIIRKIPHYFSILLIFLSLFCLKSNNTTVENGLALEDAD